MQCKMVHWGVRFDLFFCCLFQLSTTPFAFAKYEETQNLKMFIPSDYIKEMRPPPNDEPTLVNYSMRIVDKTVDSEEMIFRMYVVFKQEWLDERILTPEEFFNGDDRFVVSSSQIFEHLWQPDLYIMNSEVTDIDTLNHKHSSVTIFKNKTIRFTEVRLIHVSCQMEFHYYPMDTQLCPVSIESFAYNENKMILGWSDTGVTLNPKSQLIQYTILPVQLEELNTYNEAKDEIFSKLVVYFRLKREIGHHVIQFFGPSTLIVTLSWFSFWLSLDAVPGRVTLLVTCLLSLVTMFAGVRRDIPDVSYVTALDLWMFGCLIAVFGAFSEFVVVKYLDERYKAHKEKEKLSKSLDEETISTKYSNWSIGASLNSLNSKLYKRSASITSSPFSFKTDENVNRLLWKEIDKISCMLFPVLFLFFALLYWTIVLFESSTKIQ